MSRLAVATRSSGISWTPFKGGKWLPNQDMAWRLCEQAVVRIRELENEVGCFFDRNATGRCIRKPSPGRRQTGRCTRAI